MRTPLKNLIRIHDWEVDEKRRRLGDLLHMQEDLRGQRIRIDEELLREQALARENPEAGVFYGPYAENIIERRQRLDQSILKMDDEIIQARDVVREAFRELKKYEVAQERRDEEDKLERDREEQLQLDEIGLMRSVKRRS